MLEPFTPRLFRRLQQLKIHTRRAFLGSRQGVHGSLRRGHGLEFSDFRLYAPGDDFRYIDWGAFGRTDRLYVRQFREEQDLNVLVLLDTSASMAYPQQSGKYELARNIALALGYVALTDGDSVTFALLGQLASPRFRSPRAMWRAAELLRKAEPKGAVDIVAEVRAALSNHKLPGKCFFISDFLFETERQIECLDMIRGYNFDLAVVHTLAPSELRLELPESSLLAVDAENGEVVELALGDSSRQEYARFLSAHIRQLEKYCAQHGVSYVLISADEPLEDVVLTRFPAAGILK